MPPCRPAFDRFFDLPQQPLDRIAEQRHFVQNVHDLLLQPGIRWIHPQPIKILRHAANARADRHFVVVQNHQQLRSSSRRHCSSPRRRCRRETRHRQSPPRCAAADAPSNSSPLFKPKRGRHAAAGVAGHEQVVRAFLRVRVTHQAALGANRVKLPVPPGDQLVRINLVAGVPNQPIAG